MDLNSNSIFESIGKFSFLFSKSCYFLRKKINSMLDLCYYGILEIPTNKNMKGKL